MIPHARTLGRKAGNPDLDTRQERGAIIDPGPHIAIVKHNADATRRGSLTVWTPILGDPQDNPNTWVQVSYASPYISHTEFKSDENDYDNTRHSAGIWVPSPDVGSRVLITFPGGRKSEGVWFACLPDRFNNRTIPGLASSENWDPKTDKHGSGNSTEFRHTDGTYDTMQPVGEFIEKRQKTAKDYFNTPVSIEDEEKPINYFLARIFKEQGLNSDLIRGHTTSSAQRESPSEVFGISTKGKSYYPNYSDTNLTELIQKLKSGNIETGLTPQEQSIMRGNRRKPGHTLVMDDGDLVGDSQLIRIRSSSGHQILMHDTKGIMYVGNSKGSVWLEFSNDGVIDLYSQDSINLRTKNFNFYAEQDMNFHAKGSININADNKVHIDAGLVNVKSVEGSISLDSKTNIEIKALSNINIDSAANINIKGGPEIMIDAGCIELGNGVGSAQGVVELIKGYKSDTKKDTAGFWKSNDNEILTINTRVPTHEPFKDRTVKQESMTVVKQNTNGNTTPVFPEELQQEESVGEIQAKQQVIKKEDKLERSSTILQPKPSTSVGNLSDEETKRLFAVIGQNESNGNYDAVNQYGYVGKYQMGLAALEDTGYIKKGTYQSARLAGYSESQINLVLDDPNVWTGSNGISSKDEFLSNRPAQELAMEKYTNQNYNTLTRIGVINDTTPKDKVAGLIMASHLKGPGDVKKWNATGGVYADANGTTIDKYYNIGRSVI